MSYQAYYTCKGAKQGANKGTSERTAHKAKVAVERFDTECLAPRDAIDGKAKGRRVHKPLKIAQELDANVPFIMSALVANELLPEFVLELWQKNVQTGDDENHFTITLVDAHIVSARIVTGFDGLGSGNSESASTSKNTSEYDTRDILEFALSFRSIKWEHKIGKTMVTDDWLAANVS
jgi:type VI secretion system Hcp family effector